MLLLYNMGCMSLWICVPHTLQTIYDKYVTREVCKLQTVPCIAPWRVTTKQQKPRISGS